MVDVSMAKPEAKGAVNGTKTEMVQKKSQSEIEVLQPFKTDKGPTKDTKTTEKSEIERIKKEEKKRREQLLAEKVKREAQQRLREQQRKEKEQRLSQLRKGIEGALVEGEVNKAEQGIVAYRKLKGDRALREPQFQGYRQKLIELKQTVADLEQAKAAELYLQQLLNQASVLAEQGKFEKSQVKYGEILAIDPDSNAAREGLVALAEMKVALKKDKKRENAAVSSVETGVTTKQAPKEAAIVLGKDTAGWVVQVATYTDGNKKEAYSLLGSIKRAGIKPVYVKKVELAGRTLYRVRIGVYANKVGAEAAQQMLKEKIGTDGGRFTPRVMLQQ